MPQNKKPTFIVEPLGPHHDRAAFSCGVDSLDAYLKKQAGQERRKNISRIYVTTSPGNSQVIGYYTLSSISVSVDGLPEEQARKLPRYPDIPAALIGRLAVCKSAQGKGIGELLLMDALKQICNLSTKLGIYAIIVDARDEQASAFYEKYGFCHFLGHPKRMFIPLATVQKSFA